MFYVFFLYSIILLFKLCMMIPLFVLPSDFRVSLLRMLSSLFYFLIRLVILFFKTEKMFLHSILLTYKEATQTFNIFCKFCFLNICIFFIKTRMTTKQISKIRRKGNRTITLVKCQNLLIKSHYNFQEV